MNDLEGMTFHSAEREVEILEQQLEQARQEAADLWRQLEATQAEMASLRRQVAEAQGKIAADEIQFGKYAAEIEATHRELEQAQAEIAAMPRAEIAELCALIDGSTTAISLDCPAGWAVREWLETYDSPATDEGEWLDSNEAADLRQKLATARVAITDMQAERADLRRQLALRQLELAGALGNAADLRQERDAARAEAANLRRQLGVVPMGDMFARGEMASSAADAWDYPPYREEP